MSNFRFRTWYGLSLLLLLVGCGEPTTNVRGEVYLDGRLHGSGTRNVVKISLVPVAEEEPQSSKAAVTADVSKSGQFSIDDLPPGEYAVQIHDFAPYPFNDRLASHFRRHPKALITKVPPDETLKLELRSDWYQDARHRRRR